MTSLFARGKVDVKDSFGAKAWERAFSQVITTAIIGYSLANMRSTRTSTGKLSLDTHL